MTVTQPDGRAPCSWCERPIPTGARRDARFCSTRCRQAAHRFTRAATRRSPALVSASMRLAYADPPYPGLAHRYYAGHPDFAGEVDHRQLLEQLARYDGWALSTNTRSLAVVLAHAQAYEPRPVRIAAWHRGARPRTTYAGPLSAWEPVLYVPARLAGFHVEDVLTHHSRPRTTDPRRVIGAKPAAVARWIFELLGAEPDDTLDDLFPGSGGVARAFDIYSSREYSGDGSVVSGSGSGS